MKLSVKTNILILMWLVYGAAVLMLLPRISTLKAMNASVNQLKVIRDNSNGCEYFITAHLIMPRLDDSGRHHCAAMEA